MKGERYSTSQINRILFDFAHSWYFFKHKYMLGTKLAIRWKLLYIANYIISIYIKMLLFLLLLQSKELGFSKLMGAIAACSLKTVKDQLGLLSR